MRTSYAVGRYSATGTTEGDALLQPRQARAAGTARGVMLCHGATDVGRYAITGNYRNAAEKLARHGFNVCAPDLGAVAGVSDTWGNATAMSRMDDAWAWIKNAAGGGAKTDKVCLVGGSMGGLNAVNWASRNPTKVAAIALVIPALDLEDIYVNDRGPGLRAQIQAAYGGAPDYTQRSPLLLASSIAGIPTRVWYSTNDVVTPAATTLSFIGSVGQSVSARSMGAVGHTFLAVSPDEVLAFLAPYV